MKHVAGDESLERNERKEKAKLNFNRIVAFLAGAVLVFAVMSFTVVTSANNRNAELTKTLDTSRFEAGRLLADAKAQFAARDFAKARVSLTTLFDNQPGSAETVEGKKLLSSIDAAEKAADAKWEAAVAGIKKKWTSDFANDLRAKSEQARAQMEKDMATTSDQEWEKAKAKVRENWEKQI
jgi:hypothetical protein